MASVTWRPTASSGNSHSGTADSYSGWLCFSSGSEEAVYTNVHTYIDDSTADDTSTEICARSASTTVETFSVDLTFSGTAIPSNAKVSSYTLYVRGYTNSKPSSLTATATTKTSSSTTIKAHDISSINTADGTYVTKSFSQTTTSIPNKMNLTVKIKDTSADDKVATDLRITQIYIVINYDLYYTTTVTQTTGGTISVSPSGEQKSGTTITITASPNSGYVLDKYIVNGTNTTTATFSLTSNTTVSASWILNMFIQKNSSPSRIKEIYKKINGSWVKQTDNISTLFSKDIKYYYGNKT